MNSRMSVLVFVLVSALALGACSTNSEAEEARQATVDAMDVQIQQQ